MGKKDKKDKENTINTTHPQKKQTEMSVQKNENVDENNTVFLYKCRSTKK